jgi:hypothetical protein
MLHIYTFMYIFLIYAVDFGYCDHSFFNYGLRGYWHCGHSWPIVPASGDSEDDYGEADGM